VDVKYYETMVIFSIAKLSERTGLTAIVHVSPMPFFSLSTKLHSPSMLCVRVHARVRVLLFDAIKNAYSLLVLVLEFKTCYF
jgi:hypothetical protein